MFKVDKHSFPTSLGGKNFPSLAKTNKLNLVKETTADIIPKLRKYFVIKIFIMSKQVMYRATTGL